MSDLHPAQADPDGNVWTYNRTTGEWENVGQIGSGGGGNGGGGMVELDRWEHSQAGDSSTIEFTGISQDYDDLVLDLRLRSDRTTTSDQDRLDVLFGGSSFDTGSNYGLVHRRVGSDHSTSETASASQWVTPVGSVAANASGQLHARCRVEIYDYAVLEHRIVYSTAQALPADSGAWRLIAWNSGVWRNATDGLERIRLTPNSGEDLIGGWAVLYGVKHS